MSSWLSSFGDWANTNAQGINAVANTVGTLGSLGGAYMSYKSMQDQNDLIRQQNNLAMQTYNRNVAKEDQAQSNLDSGFSGLQFGTNKKKKQLGNYYTA